MKEIYEPLLLLAIIIGLGVSVFYPSFIIIPLLLLGCGFAGGLGEL